MGCEAKGGPTVFLGFLGTHTPKLDEKGRFFLPVKFREPLTNGLVVTKGQDHCLVIQTPAAFTETANRFYAGSPTVREVRDFQRTVFAGASEQVPDKQGRISLPPTLRAYAGLDKDIVVIGVGTRIEVWDAAAWDAFEARQDEAFSALDGELFESRPPMDAGPVR